MGIASGLKAIGTLWAKTHPELIPVTKTALEKIVSMAVDSALAKPSTDVVSRNNNGLPNENQQQFSEGGY